MRDALVHVGWHGSVLGLILLASLLAIAMAYQAFFALFAGAWDSSATLLLIAAVAVTCVKWLCDNRDELVEA